MPQLTKYNSYEALKADTNRTAENEQQAIDRQMAMKDFFKLLRENVVAQKEKEAHPAKQTGSDEQ